MAQGKVEICGVNTSKLPLLKEEEKEALFLRIKAGDMEAKEEYIKGNLRLVLSVIKRFSNSNENPDDLFQVGCIGLMKAIDNFDLSQGVKFSTYAVPVSYTHLDVYKRQELGLFGAIAIILLFILLLWRCMIIANNAPDLYGALIVIGVMAQIGLQVIINIGVVTNTLPNTGIPLPFISYGGTSVTFLLCEVGLILSVSRSIKFKR